MTHVFLKTKINKRSRLHIYCFEHLVIDAHAVNVFYALSRGMSIQTYSYNIPSDNNLKQHNTAAEYTFKGTFTLSRRRVKDGLVQTIGAAAAGNGVTTAVTSSR